MSCLLELNNIPVHGGRDDGPQGNVRSCVDGRRWVQIQIFIDEILYMKYFIEILYTKSLLMHKIHVELQNLSKSFIETHNYNTSYNTKNTKYDRVRTYIHIYVYSKPLYKITKAFGQLQKNKQESNDVQLLCMAIVQNENIYILVEVECRSNFFQVPCSSTADGSKIINIIFFCDGKVKLKYLLQY